MSYKILLMVMDKKRAFADLLVALCEKKNLEERGRQAALVRALKADGITVTQPAVKKWLDGDSMPSMAKAVGIAKFFNIQVSDLLSGNKQALVKLNSYQVEETSLNTPNVGKSDWPFGASVTPAQYEVLTTDEKDAVVNVILSFWQKHQKTKRTASN
ncbi:helix-turn-helix transcriptional regulator [Methylobacillus flagellatus]|uniref:helix-turn-helix domain-containing protein n=1 Tax=Methylobacillus flagellatus TaxID=405 RepID=UPI002853DC53|nr:helix-turn-helix transcriptional regulator [Methylobacillus flagellatus]MDR5170710.1 helix-turn-helix transcriptional regulator [Methylobacillus flagellatus]